VTTNRIESDTDKEAAYRTLVSYRTGDVWVPKLDSTEALTCVSAEFLEAIMHKRAPLTDGAAGLRVVRLLEAAQESINQGGRLIEL
jgi:predicted dehydrogenase